MLVVVTGSVLKDYNTMDASYSVSIVGDDVLFQMLSSGKKLLKAKDFQSALKLFEAAKVHCLRNKWGSSEVQADGGALDSR